MPPRNPVILLALATALAGMPGGAEPAKRAFVLDSGAHALVAIELATGKRLSTVPLQGTPETMQRSPNGSRLVVFDRGPGEGKGERGYKATGKSAATIVDTQTLSVVGRVELGSGLEADRAYFSPDGRRLTLLCPGYEAKNPAESQARELVIVDLETASEADRLILEHGAVPIAASKDGRTLPLIQGLPRSDRFPYPQSRLWIVDLAAPSVAAKLDMGTWTNLYTDGAHFYLLDPGKPDNNPQKNRNGSVQVASIESRTLAGSFDAGRQPLGLVQDEVGGQVLILSEGPPGANEGELRVVRGATLAATLKVAAHPRLVERRQDAVYVVGERAVTVVDPAALQVTARIPLGKGNDEFVGTGDVPTELAISGDRKRAFILYGVDNKLVVLDLEQHKAVGVTKTGRGSKHFLRGLGKLNAMAIGGGLGQLAGLPFGYNQWALAATSSMLAVRPDGRFAYALNMQTKDVTIVDSNTAEAVEKIGAAGYRVELLTGGGTMGIVSGSELHLLDTTTNQMTADLELKDLRGLFMSPDGTFAVAPADRAVFVLDGATGKVLARLTDFEKPEVVVFDQPDGQVVP